ncbi:hypothetical protein Ftrac_2295 [Marivirga tractuosa DSM 4126]|uniref:Lipocalin-like domain-containing protein n=2 Tax=Marivirga TaxID=869806 RepID=E4TKX1_MARTH|nr:hypothetical protein Ftrac_2295 [Marivirga tractuosa DSM 4126]
MDMKRFIYLMIIAFFILSCNEDEARPPFDNQEFYENHQAANWTKVSAKEHLQGKWQLTHTYCCPMSPNTGWASIEEGYFLLEFKGDSVKVFTNNSLDQTQYWEFDERYERSLYLETEAPISNTFGTIYFSEDYMLFNGSPSDGADNYFQKVE